MKQVNVHEALGPALDWLVLTAILGTPAKVGNFGTIIPWTTRHEPMWSGRAFRPSTTDHRFYTQIVEREKINVLWGKGVWYADMYWRSVDVIPAGEDIDSYRCGTDGPTPQIAALRCFVVSRLGDVAEVPEELK